MEQRFSSVLYWPCFEGMQVQTALGAPPGEKCGFTIGHSSRSRACLPRFDSQPRPGGITPSPSLRVPAHDMLQATDVDRFPKETTHGTGYRRQAEMAADRCRNPGRVADHPGTTGCTRFDQQPSGGRLAALSGTLLPCLPDPGFSEQATFWYPSTLLTGSRLLGATGPTEHSSRSFSSIPSAPG